MARARKSSTPTAVHTIPTPIFRLLQRTEVFNPSTDYRIHDECFELVPASWANTRHRSGTHYFREITRVPLQIRIA